MYFDVSARKLLYLFLLTAVLTVLVVVSVGTFRTYDESLRLVRNAIDRVEAEIVYWTVYKVPLEIKRPFAAIGLVPDTLYRSVSVSGTAQSVPVLAYHGENAATTTMPTALFVEHMRTLKAAGWKTITIKEFERFMKGELQVPDKSFVLTFDDGRRDAFYANDPVLKDLGFTAVMFVVTGFSLPDNGPAAISEFYLSKSELEYMVRSGRWEFLSHGDQDHRGYIVPIAATTSAVFVSGGHFLSNKFWVPEAGRIETDEEYATRVSHDLAVSKQTLEETFGVPITGFAFPFNDFGQESSNFPESITLLERLATAQYDYLYYQSWDGSGDTFNYPDPNQNFIKRIEPLENWPSERLLAVLEGGRVKPLPYTADSFSFDWTSNWGTLQGGIELALRATPETTGASAILDGTASWRNYRIRATARVENGTVSLIARHVAPDEPYIVCAFAGDRIYLERHRGQEQETLSRVDYAPPQEPATWGIAMEVRGNTARCSAYGTAVESTITGVSESGGIGASVWDPNLGDAKVALTTFSAEPL